MVNFADLGGPWESWGALGGVLGAPWGLQSELWGVLGGSQGQGHRSQRLQGGVWERTLALPRTVHMHKIHIFVRYFDDLQKRRLLRMPKKMHRA